LGDVYYTSNFFDKKCPVFHTLSYHTEILPPADEELKNWWNSLEEDWRQALLHNLFIQKNWLYADMNQQFHGMIFKIVLEGLFPKDFIDKINNTPPTLEDLRLISQIKILYLSGYDFTNLKPARLLKGVKLLAWEGGGDFESWDGLEELTQLEELHITIYFSDKKPNHLFLSNLKKLRHLTFDPYTEKELRIVQQLPQLRSLYFVADFEADPSIFLKLPKLKTLFASDRSKARNPKKQKVIDQLREKGVEVTWQVETEDFDTFNY
jgi:hypothetical protein